MLHRSPCQVKLKRNQASNDAEKPGMIERARNAKSDVQLRKLDSGHAQHIFLIEGRAVIMENER